MTNVIEFLERMGRDAELRHASEAVLEQAMRDAQMSSRARAALMGGDRAELEAVMGVESNGCCEEEQTKAAFAVDDNVCCMIYIPAEGEEECDAAGRRKAA